MSSGSKNYDEVEPYTDSWGNTAYSGNICLDHACRPVLLDAESKEHPIISCSSGDNTQSYVTKAERDAEHDNQCAVPFFMPAIYHMYRTDEPLVDLKRHAQRNSAYNRPEKVEDFPIKVQNEGGNPRSRGSAPFSSNWRTRPNSTGKDGSGNTNLHGDDSSGNRDKQSEVYPQLTKVANPINENKDVLIATSLAKKNQVRVHTIAPRTNPKERKLRIARIHNHATKLQQVKTCLRKSSAGKKAWFLELLIRAKLLKAQHCRE